MTGRQLSPGDFKRRLDAIVEEFRDRLDMLEESGQVTQLARSLTESALARIGQELGLELTEDNAAQFATHLAIALTRLQRGEPAIELSAVVSEELASHERERELVRQVISDCEELLGRSVPQVEIDYMTIHVCALVEEEP